jgi:hypothetical protein
MLISKFLPTKQLCITLIVFAFFAQAYGQGNKVSAQKTNDDSAATKVKSKTQPKANADSKKQPAALNTFIPKGYTELYTAYGDLNLDQYPDAVLVLKKDGEDTTSDVVEHPEKRPLLILIGQADKSYKLTARNDNAVYCVNCGGMMGDPFQEVVIKKGYFSVEHYGGSANRWTRVITFKYAAAGNNWYLYKDGGESFNANIPDKVKTTVKTTKNFGKIPFDKFDIYKEN